MLVLLGREFEFLLVLEQVLFVAERFLLLVLELVVRVVVAVVVDELRTCDVVSDRGTGEGEKHRPASAEKRVRRNHAPCARAW